MVEDKAIFTRDLEPFIETIAKLDSRSSEGSAKQLQKYCVGPTGILCDKICLKLKGKQAEIEAENIKNTRNVLKK